MKRLIMTIMLLLVTSSGAVAAKLPPISDAPTGPYRLGTGDEVRVGVFSLDAASNTYVIGDDGTISMPLVGLVKAQGKSASELEAGITAALRDKNLVREPSVSVQVTKYRPFFILGQVQKPGQYPYVPGMSVLTAVSIAGGYTFRAETKKATIARSAEGRTVKGQAAPETRVQPGDTIDIAEGWF